MTREALRGTRAPSDAQLAAEPKQSFMVRSAGAVDLYDRLDLIPFAELTTCFPNLK